MNNVIARKNLEAALKDADSDKQIQCKYSKELKAVFQDSHLTFRYICLTAILAKLTDANIHPRSLQAKARLEGAYDARSLCHGVIVPFDRSKLEGRLGASNEPFLNKPARFPELNMNNAVRRGGDQRLLELLHEFLESLNQESQNVLQSCLVYALRVILTRPSMIVDLPMLPNVLYPFHDVADVIKRFIDASHEGQSSAAVFGALMKSHYSNKDEEVTVHPANQAGSSSNEIGDIDILVGGEVIAVEVKDKIFTRTDVQHAAEKVQKSGNSRLIFATGPSGDSNLDLSEVERSFLLKGIDLTFVAIINAVNNALRTQPSANRKYLLQLIAATLTEMRAKDEAKQDFEQLVMNAFGSDKLFK